MTNLELKIKQLPGDDGWWKGSSEDSFLIYANKLIKMGFSEEDAINFLEAIFITVSREFGN